MPVAGSTSTGLWMGWRGLGRIAGFPGRDRVATPFHGVAPAGLEGNVARDWKRYVLGLTWALNDSRITNVDGGALKQRAINWVNPQ